MYFNEFWRNGSLGAPVFTQYKPYPVSSIPLLLLHLDHSVTPCIPSVSLLYPLFPSSVPSWNKNTKRSHSAITVHVVPEMHTLHWATREPFTGELCNVPGFWLWAIQEDITTCCNNKSIKHFTYQLFQKQNDKITISHRAFRLLGQQLAVADQALSKAIMESPYEIELVSRSWHGGLFYMTVQGFTPYL